MRQFFRAAASVFVICVAVPAARAESSWPDNFTTRLEALALMQTLNATLLGARSATFTLEKWCADHRLAPEPRIRARLMHDVAKQATPEQRQRLRVGINEPLKYRRVELTCGTRVLSEADNWYVPSRLTPEMNRLLETTDTPFGRAVQDLKPFRQTFSVDLYWKPLPDGWEMKPQPPVVSATPMPIPDKLFEHRALLFNADQMPFSEVAETYRSDVLDFSPPK